MNIRKYIVISIILLLTAGISAVLAYQRFYAFHPESDHNPMDFSEGIYQRSRVSEGNIQLYTNDRWQDMEIRGISISSFYPGAAARQSNITKEHVTKWLELAAGTGANTLYLSYLQPPAFYSALYDFNLGRAEPLYIIHGIPIDMSSVAAYHDTRQKNVVKNMQKDIRHTLDALHGQGAVPDNGRYASGFYLKDLSSYVLGYVIGNDTDADAIALTNQHYPDMTSYQGRYYTVTDGNAFECFAAENLDYLFQYESERYHTLSLYSYLSTMETDPLNHRNESRQTQNAGFDPEHIHSLKEGTGNLIATYAAQPNGTSFLDYEYSDTPVLLSEDQPSGYRRYLERLSQHHTLPLLIIGTGISAARGVSTINLTDGYDRGGHNEQEQADLLIRLLEDIKTAGCQGVVIQSLTDEWTLTSPYTDEYTDPNAAPDWHDIQSSDTSFGIAEFKPGTDGQPVCLVDGNAVEWSSARQTIDESQGIYMGVMCDTEYLYLMAEIPGFIPTQDTLYFAFDVTPKSGGMQWAQADLTLPFPTDFLLNVNGYNETRLLVHSRYDLFLYRYSYYSYILDKQAEMPAKDAPDFNGIYQMNRYNIYLNESRRMDPVRYQETGDLRYGNADHLSEEYDSLTDFAVAEQILEVRIPWALINMRDPVRHEIQPDFFTQGLGDSINIHSIGIGMIYQSADGNVTARNEIKYRLPNLKKQKYYIRARAAAYALKEYWTGEIQEEIK